MQAAINSSQIVRNGGEQQSFKPFDCKTLKTKYLRVNNLNDCLIIQELSNEYEVKSHKVDPNTWNRSLLLRYIDNKDGEKIVAHTWNNVVKWGESSNKQPFSHLAVIDIPNVSEIFESNLNQYLLITIRYLLQPEELILLIQIMMVIKK